MQSLAQHFKRHYLRKNRLFQIFIAFLKYALNLQHFRKEYEYPSLIFSEIIDAERRGYLHVQKVLLKNTIP